MTGLLDTYLGLIYQFYGASFLILGAIALLIPRQSAELPFAPHLWLLGCFGLLHGSHVFVDWEDPGLAGMNVTLLLLSYLPLLEFGRRALIIMSRRILPALGLYLVSAIGMLVFTLWASDPLNGFDAGIRYFVGGPGAMLTGCALYLTLRGMPHWHQLNRLHGWLLVAAVAFFSYGTLTLFLPQPDASLRSWLPNQADYLSTFGIPVQLTQAICAFAAALALLAITWRTNQSNFEDLNRVLGTISGFVYRCENKPDWPAGYLAGNLEGISGYAINDFMRPGGVLWGQLVHHEDRERVQLAVEAGIERRHMFELSYRIVARNGHVHWVQERGQAVYDELGRVKYLQGHITDVSELVAAKERLERAEEYARLGHWEFRAGSAEGYWSRQMFRLFNIDPRRGTPATTDFLLLIHPDDREKLMDAMRAMTQGRIPVDSIYRSNPELGPVKYLNPTSMFIQNDAGEITHFTGTLQDITAQHCVLQELQQSQQRQTELLALSQREQSRMRALLSGMSIGILFEDREGCVEYVNPAFLRMWAIADGTPLTGRPTADVLEHSTHRFARPDHASKHVLHVLETHEISERFELDLYDGRILTQLSYPVSDPDGRILGRLWIYEDITHERQTAQQLVYLAEHDPLTGLCNRHRFQEQLEWMIRGAERNSTRFAVLYFDLDDFKYINDTFGHRAGDTVLVRTAGEVASLVRSGDMFARLGGDEFAILTELAPQDDPSLLAERISRAVAAIPFRFRGSNFRLTTSIGITIYPMHGDNAEDLVAHADTAMYQAKNAGKNTWSLYDPTRDLSEAMMTRMTWTSRIAHALEHELFELHFQGIYRTGNGELNHLEALVRMQDPARPLDLIMPGQFIPIAEKSGHILEIDRWVLRRSIATLASHPHLPALAVNVSGRSFDDPLLTKYIQQLLEEYDVAPARLIIELTETAAVSEMQDAQRFIEALQLTGCCVCLDDFGTGFSTFAYLKYLGVQVLKIDGMFIRDLPNHPDNQAFVKAMNDVGHGLKKLTVAEFVEDAATLEMLRDLGVDLAQGYYLDRPCANHPILSQQDVLLS